MRQLFRAAFILLCLFALVRSARMGYADALARSGQPESVARAIRIEPGNTLWKARRATNRFGAGDNSPENERDLLQSLAVRPNDAEVLMALGLIAEQHGDTAKAEAYLLRASAADHRFKPSWTTANFYFRTNQFGKMWPYLEKCLSLIEPKSLEPLSFDPAPIFSLAWEASGDPKFIARLIPKRRETLLPYLSFVTTPFFTTHPNVRNPDPARRANPLESAMLMWPDVIRTAQPGDRETLLRFLDQIVQTGPAAGAVRVWNDLVDRGMALGAKLDPAAGRSLADPRFEHAQFRHGFGWQIPDAPGISTSTSPSVSLEFSGTEPEQIKLLYAYAPVLRGRRYRVHWRLDRAQAGLSTEVRTANSASLTAGSLDAEFQMPADVAPQVELALRYNRAPGQVRLRGQVVIAGADLELVP